MKITTFRCPIYSNPRVLYEQAETSKDFIFGVRTTYAGHLRVWIDWNPESCPIPEFVDKVLAVLIDTNVPDNFEFHPDAMWDKKRLEIGMRVWGVLNCEKEGVVGEFMLENHEE